MNPEIRTTVKSILAERRITQSELAEKIGVSPQSISRLLASDKDLGLWGDVLQQLGLQLTVRSRSEAPSILMGVIKEALEAKEHITSSGKTIFMLGDRKNIGDDLSIIFEKDKWYLTIRNAQFSIYELGTIEDVFTEHGELSNVTFYISDGPLGGHIIDLLSPENSFRIEPVTLELD